MRPIQDALPLLATPQKIFIITHHKPDGDAVGSVLGLTHYLMQKGHTVFPVVPSEVPNFLMWLPIVELLFNFEAESKKCFQLFQEADLVFCLDFNDPTRTKHLTTELEQTKKPKILIDHHLFPKDVWDFGMSVPEKSSTCEMVYDFINIDKGNTLIDQPIATCLYTGVLTDTGSFRFSCTTAETHAMVADLKSKGLEHTTIHEAVSDCWSPNRMRFLGYVLMQKMELFPEYQAGLIALDKNDLRQFDVSLNDTEGFVNQPLSVEGIRFATLITERNDEVRLSFRSKGNFDVNAFARQYFNGGGHFNASGGKSNLSFQETINFFKQILSEIHPDN